MTVRSDMEVLVVNRGSSNEPGFDEFAETDDSAAHDPATDGARTGPLRVGQNDINGLETGSNLLAAGGRRAGRFTSAGRDSRVLACRPTLPIDCDPGPGTHGDYFIR
jgi:hypothetical protein